MKLILPWGMGFVCCDLKGTPCSFSNIYICCDLENHSCLRILKTCSVLARKYFWTNLLWIILGSLLVRVELCVEVRQCWREHVYWVAQLCRLGGSVWKLVFNKSTHSHTQACFSASLVISVDSRAVAYRFTQASTHTPTRTYTLKPVHKNTHALFYYVTLRRSFFVADQRKLYFSWIHLWKLSCSFQLVGEVLNKLTLSYMT